MKKKCLPAQCPDALALVHRSRRSTRPFGFSHAAAYRRRHSLGMSPRMSSTVSPSKPTRSVYPCPDPVKIGPSCPGRRRWSPAWPFRGSLWKEETADRWGSTGCPLNVARSDKSDRLARITGRYPGGKSIPLSLVRQTLVAGTWDQRDGASVSWKQSGNVPGWEQETNVQGYQPINQSIDQSNKQTINQ